jgi:hypothetical protein
VVDVWGADWRGMRPRLLAALADSEIGVIPPRWVTLESAASRLAARYPMLLGPSFMAATARLGSETGAGMDEEAARAAALSDVIALELGGPFVWFGLVETVDSPGKPRAFRLTPAGTALAARKPPPAEDDSGAALAPLFVAASGEITLQTPSPERVWALSAFAEPVDLGPHSHYRLTPGSIGSALARGIEREHIVAFLERAARQPLPGELAANLKTWARGHRQVVMRRAVILDLDDVGERPRVLQVLQDAGWAAEPLGNLAILVPLDSASPAMDRGEDALLVALRAAGHSPRWKTNPDDESSFTASAPAGQVTHPADD